MESNIKRPRNYLVIDGGRSGLPALCIMEEMLVRLQFDLEMDDEIRACDHYDLLSGSGAGAVAAILLGRMGLSISQAISAYLKLESALSVPPTNDENERRRNTEAFKTAFTQVLLDAGFAVDAPMADKAAPKTVVWTLNTIDLTISQPIRSYRVRSAPGPSCTILEAACAGVASPDKFMPITLGEGHKKIVLIDATTGFANPTKELLTEAQRLFGEDDEVASIVSLGAGKEATLGVHETAEGDVLVDALKRMALDSERTHQEMHARLHQSSAYFRFNVERGLDRDIEASSVRTYTSAYLQDSATDKLLDEAVKSIKNRQTGGTLKDINSVHVVEPKSKPRPSLVENFVGREDILDALRKNHFSTRSPELRKPAISVLMGLGGSGKTQTALKFALEYESKYPDGPVYFFDGSSEDRLKAEYALATRMRGTPYRSQSHNDALLWFANREDDWLIIIDNADDPSVELFQFIPKSSHGNVIITTRNSTYKILAPASSHRLEGLPPSDAVALILAVSSYGDNEANQLYAQAIAKELGYLPLALAHAAAYISIHRCLPTYLSMYQRSRAKFLASKQALPQDYKLSVATTIQMSFESISEVARDIMALLSLLHASLIAHSIIAISAERMFYQISGQSEDETTDQLTTQHANTLMDIFCPSGEWLESDFNDIIQQCLQYSLLQVTTQGDVRFYSMHVLVQTYLQSSLGMIRDYRPEQLVIRLLGSAITVNHHYQYQAFNRLLVPHLRLVAVKDVIEAGDHDGFGQVLDEQGSSKLSIEHFERCLDLRRSSLGDEHTDTLLVMTNLGKLYHDLGRPQAALDLEEKVLSIRMRISGEEHPTTLLAMSNLARSYDIIGRHMEALRLEQKVLRIHKQRLGNDSAITALAMTNLAATYSALGRHQEALDLEEEVLQLLQRKMGDDHPETIRAMANLSVSYNDMGRHQEALNLDEQVLEKRKQLLGDEHPLTLISMRNLAITFHKLGMTGKAIELIRATLALYEEVRGKDHPQTLEVRECLDFLEEAYRSIA